MGNGGEAIESQRLVEVFKSFGLQITKMAHYFCIGVV
jgi:hypothetical protein